jgi:two-component system nitrogen regulation response regulator GlnG
MLRRSLIYSGCQSDLSEFVAAGRFRADLYYRISGFVLDVPPLRARVSDIGLLTDHFIAASSRLSPAADTISADALRRLEQFSWPGNVRQLENTVLRLAATATGSEITLEEVNAALSQNTAGGQTIQQTEKLSASVENHIRRYFDLHGGALPPPGLYGRILREIELPLIEIALEATAGNQAKCADLLGINRNTLRKKITELEIRVTRGRKMM